MSDNEQQGDQQDQPSGLRAKIEELAAENGRLQQQLRTYTFKEAGIDPTSGVGELIAKTYEGEYTVDAIREYAERYGVNASPATEPPSEREQTESRIEATMASSTPYEGKTMGKDEFFQLSKDNPEAAHAALQAGRVELPAHLVNALNQ